MNRQGCRKGISDVAASLRDFLRLFRSGFDEPVGDWPVVGGIRPVGACRLDQSWIGFRSRPVESPSDVADPVRQRARTATIMHASLLMVPAETDIVVDLKRPELVFG